MAEKEHITKHINAKDVTVFTAREKVSNWKD
jgi:hypothetical protein